MSYKKHFVSRRYHIYYKFEREEALLMDKRVSDVLNNTDKDLSLSEAYAYLFTKGVEATEMEQNENGVNLKHAKIAKALSQIMEEKATKNILIKLYEGMGLEKFVDLCEELEVDWKEFLEEYKWMQQNKQPSWTEATELWLQDFLSDENLHHTNEIKQAAIDEKIIDMSNQTGAKRQWDNIRQIAHRKGFTSAEKGYWQYIPNPKFNFVTP